MLMPLPAVVGAVPLMAVVLSVTVVELTAVTRARKTGVVAPSVNTLANWPTVTDADGSPLVGVKTPVPEFQPPFVAL